ncbi:MAG: response regulator [Nitrospinae bacterium]|nr:response regulator [Nitrospinota bacterium]
MGKKILLADDSITIQKIIELTFEGEGFDLEVVGDGQEALERAEASPPDIILADFTMPGLSGVELCRKIREHPILNPVPFILLTNYFDEFDRSEGDAAGVTDYLEKPFESQALLGLVHELLSVERASAPDEEEELTTFDIQARAVSDMPSETDVLGFSPLVYGLDALLNDKDTKLPLAVAVTAPWGGANPQSCYSSRKSCKLPPVETALASGGAGTRFPSKRGNSRRASVSGQQWRRPSISSP